MDAVKLTLSKRVRGQARGRTCEGLGFESRILQFGIHYIK